MYAWQGAPPSACRHSSIVESEIFRPPSTVPPTFTTPFASSVSVSVSPSGVSHPYAPTRSARSPTASLSFQKSRLASNARLPSVPAATTAPATGATAFCPFTSRLHAFLNVFFPILHDAVPDTMNRPLVATLEAEYPLAENVQFVPQHAIFPEIFPVAPTAIVAKPHGERDSCDVTVATGVSSAAHTAPLKFPRAQAGRAAIEIGNFFDDAFSFAFAALLTVMVAVNVPALVGTPLITPVVASILSPFGSPFAENFTG